MIQQILQTKFVRWKKSVGLVALLTTHLTNGSGLYLLPLPRICYLLSFFFFRFITPIFLHAGFVHIILNMLAQMTVSAQIEREMGSGGFLITYFAAGIFGCVNFQKIYSTI